MSTLPHAVAAQGRTFTVVEDRLLRTDALVVAKLAGRGAAGRVTSVRSLSAHTSAHVASGGWAVVCGDPDVVCPDLATTAYRFEFEISGPHTRFTAGVDVPAGSSLPFAAADLEVSVAPIAIAGTVTERAFPNNPIANATVTLAGPHPLGSLLGLRTDLSSPHPLGTTVRVISATIGTPFTVTEATPGGARHLALNSTAGLAPGDLLAWRDGEFGFIGLVDTGSAHATLRLPTRRTLNVGETVNKVTLAAPGADSWLARESLEGDGVVVIAAAIAGATIEVDDPDPERREVRRTNVVTDAGGRYRIVGVRGIDAVSLRFSAGGFTPLGPLSYPLNPRLDPTVIDAALAV